MSEELGALHHKAPTANAVIDRMDEILAIGRFVAARAAAMTTGPATEETADVPEAAGLDGAAVNAMDTVHNL